MRINYEGLARIRASVSMSPHNSGNTPLEIIKDVRRSHSVSVSVHIDEGNDDFRGKGESVQFIL